ncbi:winged helix-turn-helix transcriptional regulator [Alphaproteobacteria bacterium KMM 3653]|uniref:Winged helix-turn-helix transcriptional regulator n=1 Tax=Harenicola maris TaxID=2841044 RepID=A0AAP2G4K6_9RHOB|nr:winged helix-turn-helix transcriptional regulator [Harenicola maris]
MMATMGWAQALSTAEPVMAFDDIVLEVECLRVLRGGEPVHLAPIEFLMLASLIEAPGHVWTRARLVERVWGHGAQIGKRTVDVHVARLRKALCQADKHYPIRTIRGVGYSLG